MAHMADQAASIRRYGCVEGFHHGPHVRIQDLGGDAHSSRSEARANVGDIGGRAATRVGGSDDRIATLEKRGIDRVELHAIGHKLEYPLVASREAQAIYQPRSDL